MSNCNTFCSCCKVSSENFNNDAEFEQHQERCSDRASLLKMRKKLGGSNVRDLGKRKRINPKKRMARA